MQRTYTEVQVQWIYTEVQGHRIRTDAAGRRPQMVPEGVKRVVFLITEAVRTLS